MLPAVTAWSPPALPCPHCVQGHGAVLGHCCTCFLHCRGHPRPYTPQPLPPHGRVPEAHPATGPPCHWLGTPRVLTEAMRHNGEGGKKCLLQTHGFWRLFKANFLSLGRSSNVKDPAGRRLSHSSALCLGKINRKESSSGAFLLLREMDWRLPPQENCPTVI